MTKVNLLYSGSISQLEGKINDFLATMEDKYDFRLIDIKFNCYSYGEILTDQYYAMIIYEI
jgi:hypothetical protein